MPSNAFAARYQLWPYRRFVTISCTVPERNAFFTQTINLMETDQPNNFSLSKRYNFSMLKLDDGFIRRVNA